MGQTINFLLCSSCAPLVRLLCYSCAPAMGWKGGVRSQQINELVQRRPCSKENDCFLVQRRPCSKENNENDCF